MTNPVRGVADANQAEIMQCYRECMCTPMDTHLVGFGYPDLTVGISGVTELVEVKLTDKDPLRLSQVRFQREWRGGKVTVVTCREDVIAHVKRVQEKLRNGGWR